MPGSALLDYADSLALFAWKLLSAIAIIVAVTILQRSIDKSYDEIGERGTAFNLLKVRVNAIGYFVTAVVTIGVAGFVLDDEWVRQIVSAAVVGMGFALRGFIDDTLWGFVRRNDRHIQDEIYVKVATTGADGKPAEKFVQGRVKRMTLTTFEFQPSSVESTAENASQLVPVLRHVLPWSTLRVYQYTHNGAQD